MCCGRDFSIGLTKTSKKIYVWGNYRYTGRRDDATVADEEEPTPLKFDYSQVKSGELRQFKDIYCSQTYCVALSDSNEIFKWGEFYKDLRQRKGGSEMEGGPGISKKKTAVAEEESSDDSSESSSSSSGEASSSDEEEKSMLKSAAQKDDVFKIEAFPDGP